MKEYGEEALEDVMSTKVMCRKDIMMNGKGEKAVLLLLVGCILKHLVFTLE